MPRNDTRSAKKVGQDGKEKGGAKQAEFAALREEVESGNSHSISDLGKLIILSHEKLEATITKSAEYNNQRMDAMEDNITANTDRIEQLDERLKSLEIREVRNNLIIQNLEPHKDAKEQETKDQTQECMKELLKTLGIEDKISPFICKRFKQTEQQKGYGPPTVHVQLGHFQEKAIIFRALAQNAKDMRISVANELPRSLKEKHKALRAQAADIRNGSDKKTKIELVKGRLVLKVKHDGETRFHEP